MGDFYLDVNGLSKHLSGSHYERQIGVWVDDNGNVLRKAMQSVPYRETNPGIGVRYEWGEGPLKNLLMLGEYLNSFNKQTTYAGVGAKKNIMNEGKWHIDGGAALSAMTGYGDSVKFGVLPMLQFGYGDTSLNLMAAPASGPNTSPVLMLNASYRIK